MKTMAAALLAMVAVSIGMAPQASAQRRKKKAKSVALSAVGQRLEAQYAREMARLRAGLLRALPKLSKPKLKAYDKAIEAERAAKTKLESAQAAIGGIGRARGLVGHAKGKWIGGADRGIAKAKAQLAKAKTENARRAARKELAKWQQNRKDGVKALKERQAALDKALRAEPRMKRELAAAKRALAEAKTRTQRALASLKLEPLLSSHDLDAKLAKFVVLHEAKPQRLAAFAQKSDGSRQLVDRMLGDAPLLQQILVADGAAATDYGRAMQIYSAIQGASNKAASGPLQRLALAVALEHAKPIGQRNAKADTEAATTVDPLERYLHFEKAFLAGELDPAFERLDVWDYRMVVNGEEPDEILSWGRKMLRNYRPDHVSMKDYRWRYVAAVRSDIRYGSQENKYDEDRLQFFQNILKNGGVCGRRAFFGRFMLRSFGIPTTARPQRGHAALTHWTPDGWVVCLRRRLGQWLDQDSVQRANAAQSTLAGSRLLGVDAGARGRLGLPASQAGAVDRRRRRRAAAVGATLE